MCRKGLRVGQASASGEVLQLAGPMRGGKLLEEQPTEQAGEHPNGQEEAGPA